jgi:hypothetical protein
VLAERVADPMPNAAILSLASKARQQTKNTRSDCNLTGVYVGLSTCAECSGLSALLIQASQTAFIFSGQLFRVLASQTVGPTVVMDGRCDFIWNDHIFLVGEQFLFLLDF